MNPEDAADVIQNAHEFTRLVAALRGLTDVQICQIRTCDIDLLIDARMAARKT